MAVPLHGCELRSQFSTPSGLTPTLGMSPESLCSYFLTS